MRNITLLFFNPVTQEGHREPVTSAAQLEKRLAALQEQFRFDDCHIGAMLIDDNGNELSIGLAPGEWTLTLTIGPEVAEQYCTVGNPTREGSIAFYWEQWTPVAQKELIPRQKAWEAVRHWVDTGEMMTTIRWTDQTY